MGSGGSGRWVRGRVEERWRRQAKVWARNHESGLALERALVWMGEAAVVIEILLGP